jgi:FAD/FMN-containing dehydrogenase
MVPAAPAPASHAESLLGALAGVVGARHVLVDPELTRAYTTDWTGRFRGAAAAVVRPAGTDEVAAVVATCAAHGASIVTQGGNTGLVGGAVPAADQVVVSLQRLDRIDDVDPSVGQLTAGAGVTIARLHQEAKAAGWDYGVDFGARDSATVGGSIATNAGGIRLLRHGDTRRQLLGVEAVMADGSVISHLGGLEKDNTGYHLAGLLCGSEGTLGIVTAARLRLVARTDERVVALLAFEGAAGAIEAAWALHRDLPTLDAAELFLADGLALVCDVLDLRRPFPSDHAAYLLVEAAGTSDPTAELAAAIDQLGAMDVAVATDAARRAELWRYREAHTEVINTVGAPHKLDVTLPGPTLALFLDEVVEAVRAVEPGARTWLFGHAADGNVHVNVTGVDPDDESVDDAVLQLVAARGGSISAEHGIGTAKRRWLHLARSGAEIAAMRAIKQALDPRGLLNPGVLL